MSFEFPFSSGTPSCTTHSFHILIYCNLVQICLRVSNLRYNLRAAILNVTLRGVGACFLLFCSRNLVDGIIYRYVEFFRSC